MEREEGRREWRTITIDPDGEVGNIKTNQTKAEAETCLAECRAVNPGRSYDMWNDWTPRSERDKTQGESDVVWGMVVKVVLQGRRVALFNEDGRFLIAFPVTPHLQDTVRQYLRDRTLKVSNTDTFPYLKEFALARQEA